MDRKYSSKHRKRIVGISKANNLNIYQCFKYLLTEIPKHIDDTIQTFLDSMLPWSKQLPEKEKTII